MSHRQLGQCTGGAFFILMSAVAANQALLDFVLPAVETAWCALIRKIHVTFMSANKSLLQATSGHTIFLYSALLYSTLFSGL